jgi:phosphoserine phosphatase RsbU/P
MPLGIFNDVTFRVKKVQVDSGDTILLMSDGFAERFNPRNEIIGFEETVKIFGEVAMRSPRAIIDHLVKTGDSWAAGQPQNDDITFVVLKVK